MNDDSRGAEDTQLTLAVQSALARLSDKSESNIGTYDLLLALYETDVTGDWAWLELEAGPISPDLAGDYDDVDDGTREIWHQLALTVKALAAVRLAARIADAYDLWPVPPGVLVLSLVGQESNGATRALMRNQSLSHSDLLLLVQDAILGTRLENLDQLMLSSEVPSGEDVLEPHERLPTPRSLHRTGAKSNVDVYRDTADARSGSPQVAGDTEVVTNSATGEANNEDLGEPHPQAGLSSMTDLNRPSGSARLVGVLLGALLLTAVGGVPLGLAIVLGCAAANRYISRKAEFGIPQAAITRASAVAILAAIALAVSGGADSNNERQAVQYLHSAQAFIDQRNSPKAMRSLGGASLYENRSPIINTLSACVDWGLGYKDYGALEAQVASFVGADFGRPSGYRGRDCFLDAPIIHGIAYMPHVGNMATVLYTIPDQSDAVGQRYLQIANVERTRHPYWSMVALGCLDDRYGFRALASLMLTAGLNGNLVKVPYAELQRCIGASHTKRDYGFYSDSDTGLDVYLPRDLISRIPSPSRPYAPSTACYARFPSGGPCG